MQININNNRKIIRKISVEVTEATTDKQLWNEQKYSNETKYELKTRINCWLQKSKNKKSLRTCVFIQLPIRLQFPSKTQQVAHLHFMHTNNNNNRESSVRCSVRCAVSARHQRVHNNNVITKVFATIPSLATSENPSVLLWWAIARIYIIHINRVILPSAHTTTILHYALFNGWRRQHQRRNIQFACY